MGGREGAGLKPQGVSGIVQGAGLFTFSLSLLPFSPGQEAKMSQERLADQVVSTSEEKHKMTVELEKLNKVLYGNGK